MSPEYRRTGIGLLASAFTPAKIAGLKLWLAADRITGLVDNDPVGTWPDASGNGNDATQATAAQKPLYKVNILNGKPVVRFDAVDDNMTVAANASLDLPFCTLVAAVVIIDTALFRTLIVKPSQATWAGDFARYALRINTTDKVDGWAESAAVAPANITGVTATAGATILTFVYDGATQAVVRNGTIDASEARTTGTITPSTQPFYLGENNTPGDFWNGDMAEICVYNRGLSTGERLSVERYLGNKYGIAVS